MCQPRAPSPPPPPRARLDGVGLRIGFALLAWAWSVLLPPLAGARVLCEYNPPQLPRAGTCSRWELQPKDDACFAAVTCCSVSSSACCCCCLPHGVVLPLFLLHLRINHQRSKDRNCRCCDCHSPKLAQARRATCCWHRSRASSTRRTARWRGWWTSSATTGLALGLLLLFFLWMMI